MVKLKILIRGGPSKNVYHKGLPSLPKKYQNTLNWYRIAEVTIQNDYYITRKDYDPWPIYPHIFP
jgi:hypothetical protein